MSPFSPPISISAVWPEIIVLLAGCAVLLVGQARRHAVRAAVPWVALGALVAALVVVRWPAFMNQTIPYALGSGLEYAGLADFVRVSALIFGVLVTLTAWSGSTEDERGEFFAMLLFSLGGLMLVGPATNLVILFLALELVSVPTYVMVTLSQRTAASLEAGTKYFYLGALSAAIMAYGFSFLYGVGGSATIDAVAVENIAGALRHPGTTEYGLAMIGVVVSIVGVLFKLAAVPLHFYVADVYQGASSPVAGLLGFVPKLAGLVALLKIVSLTAWAQTSAGVYWLLWIIAAISMTVGNVLALRQTNVKRMLAYSGIAHSGYMLVGLLAGPTAGESILGDGAAALLYYVVIYGIANLGAFALLALLRVRGDACETVRDLAGLLRRHPGMAWLMALSMFTLMGLPPTAGFWGKVSLFGSALSAAGSPETIAAGLKSWTVTLVIVAVLNSALAAAYYLRVIASVLLYENDEPAIAMGGEPQHIGAILCGLLTLVFAFAPGTLMQLGRGASQGVRISILSEPGIASPAPPAPAPPIRTPWVASAPEIPADSPPRATP